MVTLKTKDLSRSGLADYKKLCKEHLIAIDDIMMTAIAWQDANAFFILLINSMNKPPLSLHQQIT